MTRRNVIASWLVFALIMCAGAVVSAQDMVFTPDDSGGAAAPPPPPSGPPSEALANALRLYQQERWPQASVQFQRVVNGEAGDEPANQQKAQFFLGKCFYHMGFYQAALGVFEEIADQSTGHLYFPVTLQWLAQLSRELPDPAGIIDLVGRYGSSISVLQEFKKPETADLYNELLFLMGKHWYAQGEFAKARDFFLEINQENELRIPGIFFVGITHVRERHAQPAAKAFKSIVDQFDGKLFLSDEEERYLSLAWISLARIYYSTDHFDSALAAWNSIPQSSEHYLDALFEESWAFFRVDMLARALGNIHTINSPFFEEKFYPESLVLKAVIYFGQCLFDDAQTSVEAFRIKYEPIQVGLQDTLTKFQDNKSFFEFLRKMREFIDNDGQPDESGMAMGYPVDLFRIIKGALGDRTLLRNLEYVEVLEKEEVALAKMPAQFINSQAGIRIQQDINAAKDVAVDNTGNLARSRYERLLTETQDRLNEATRVEIEILKALRGELDMRAKAGQPDMVGPEIKKNVIKSDTEHVLWPFEGEYWRDELGYYRQPIENHCGR